MVGIIVYLILGAVIFRIIKQLVEGDASDAPARHQGHAAALPFTPISACAVCGVHVPLGESVMASDGRSYCSEAHRSQVHGQGR